MEAHAAGMRRHSMTGRGAAAIRLTRLARPRRWTRCARTRQGRGSPGRSARRALLGRRCPRSAALEARLYPAPGVAPFARQKVARRLVTGLRGQRSREMIAGQIRSHEERIESRALARHQHISAFGPEALERLEARTEIG